MSAAKAGCDELKVSSRRFDNCSQGILLSGPTGSIKAPHALARTNVVSGEWRMYILNPLYNFRWLDVKVAFRLEKKVSRFVAEEGVLGRIAPGRSPAASERSLTFEWWLLYNFTDSEYLSSCAAAR